MVKLEIRSVYVDDTQKTREESEDMLQLFEQDVISRRFEEELQSENINKMFRSNHIQDAKEIARFHLNSGIILFGDGLTDMLKEVYFVSVIEDVFKKNIENLHLENRYQAKTVEELFRKMPCFSKMKIKVISVDTNQKITICVTKKNDSYGYVNPFENRNRRPIPKRGLPRHKK